MTFRAFAERPERTERPYSTSAIAHFSALTPTASIFSDILTEERLTVCGVCATQIVSLRPLSQMERRHAVAASTVPTGAGALGGFFPDEPPSWAAAVVAVHQ